VASLRDIRRYLSRESSSGAFIPEIDGLRFVAIFAVIFHHLNGYLLAKTAHQGPRGLLSDLCARGNYGVQLFFVISGFVIAYPFARAALAGTPPPGLRRYYLRRLTRLEPPYMGNLIIAFLLLVATGRAAVQDLLPHLLASLTYTHNLVYGGFSTVNGVAWSLEIELQFYLVAPLLAGLFRIRSAAFRRGVIAGLILGASLWGQWVPRHLPRAGLSIVPFLGYFLAGFLLCDILQRDRQGTTAQRLVWDGIGLTAWGLVVVLMWSRLAFLLPFVVLVAYVAAFRGCMLRAVFRSPLIFTIGGMCYTIYLYHFFIISAVGRFALKPALAVATGVTPRLVVLALMVLPVILLSCTVLFAVTERPFMVKDWPRRAWAFVLARCRRRGVWPAMPARGPVLPK